jgi:putative Holliday junction resolvase
MNLDNEQIKYKIKGKRLLGIDFGLKRVGIAVSDELGITTTPIATLDYSATDFWENFSKILHKERATICVVGIPNYEYKTKSSIIKELNSFIEFLREKLNLEIYTFDESLTSNEATYTLVEIGKKKKTRKTKGEKDKVAAAIILRNFLNYYNG